MCDQHILDVRKIDLNNIIYIKPNFFGVYEKFLGVYYNCPDQVGRKKIIIKTPKMMIPFDIKKFDNKAHSKCQLPLSFMAIPAMANEMEIKQFYSFINEIDKLHKSTVREHSLRWNLPQTMVFKKSTQYYSKVFAPFINCNMITYPNYGDCFSVYDEFGKKSDFSILKKKDIVSTIIELTSIKFTDTEFTAEWTVISVRKHKPYSLINELIMNRGLRFDDEIEAEQEHLPPQITIKQYTKPINNDVLPPPPPLLQKNTNADKINIPTNKTFTPPSLLELKHAIKGLKKPKPDSIIFEEEGISKKVIKRAEIID